MFAVCKADVVVVGVTVDAAYGGSVVAVAGASLVYAFGAIILYAESDYTCIYMYKHKQPLGCRKKKKNGQRQKFIF